MISTIDDSKREVAAIFNSAIAAAAIGAAWELGLLDELRDHKKVDVHKFAKQHDLDSGSIQGLVTALAVVNVVERDHDTAVPGRLLDETYRNKSLFHWLALGSGGLFSRMQYVVRNENRKGSFYSRDPAAIAYACRDINLQHFDPVFWAAMDGLDYKFHSVVDLGSGSGERLMQTLDRYPGTTGIGIDVAGPAIKVATDEALERGFRDRLSFIEGDAREMVYCDEFARVDLLMCFMMGHDFWPRDNCIATLQRLRKAFPKARRFLLGDTTRILLDNPRSRHAVTEDDVPIFTLGFEFGHAMMGVYLPTMEEWEAVFAEGGWRCVKTHLIKSSYLSVIFELEHD
ncbi:methyltransferase MppJ [Lindgomyces ingoldianus]|uniref:Methyltransferase MppJ n=1 Tax=Lindgomyces ingoldianus TaxID=673940 RepID=A0ACB6R9J8_9PLEO|nr:methyltransferase MppJ [Lindgomyces ingoldianus]KAF2475999.1 methyltransferase MppJ [Lindgomyces ingoldianus]